MREIRVPKMGISTVDVDLVKWHVAPGDAVEEDSPLADVESEKATTTITAGAKGKVGELLVSEGSTTEVGALICRIEDA